MSIILAVGTTFKIVSTYGPVKAMSAVSNANPAVATLEASHGVVVGDKIHIKSGWELLNDRYVRVSAVSVNDVTLEGVNTSNTDLYPAGGGVGTVRESTATTEVTQITRDYTTSGGEQQYADVSTLKNRQDQRLPTNRSPIDVVLPVFHDPSLAWYPVVRAADGIPVAGEIVYPGNARSLFTAYWSLGNVATVSDKTLRNAVALAYANDPVEYST